MQNDVRRAHVQYSLGFYGSHAQVKRWDTEGKTSKEQAKTAIMV